MHQTSVDRYVHFNNDIWRVVCAHCGVLADGLGRYEAAHYETVFAGKACSLAGDGVPDHCALSGSEEGGRNDQQALAAWSSGLEATAGEALRAL